MTDLDLARQRARNEMIAQRFGQAGAAMANHPHQRRPIPGTHQLSMGWTHLAERDGKPI